MIKPIGFAAMTALRPAIAVFTPAIAEVTVGIIVIIIEVCYFTVGWYLAHNVWETSYTVTTDKEIGRIAHLVYWKM